MSLVTCTMFAFLLRLAILIPSSHHVQFEGALLFHVYFDTLGFRTWMFLICNSAAAKHHQLLKVFWGLRGWVFRCKTAWFSLWDSIRPSNFRLERAGPRNAAKLVQVLYYADILLDLKQLKVFADQRLYDYLRFNALGLLIPPVLTVWEACHWLQQPSPERDHFDHLVASKLMQKIIHRLGSGNPDTRDFAGDVVRSLQTETWHHVLASLGCVTRGFFVLSQVQCFGVVLCQAPSVRKHPLLQGAKNAEAGEVFPIFKMVENW